MDPHEWISHPISSKLIGICTAYYIATKSKYFLFTTISRVYLCYFTIMSMYIIVLFPPQVRCSICFIHYLKISADI